MPICSGLRAVYGTERQARSPILRLLIFAFALFAITLSSGGARAEQRIALVVGNGAYSDVGALANAAADARLIAQTLETLGFETKLILDADQSIMKRSIADFGRQLRVAEQDATGLFYFAGHGIQSDGRNFLLPVEAAPRDPADLDLESVDANWILRQMESAGNRTNIVILDACRNNPFTSNNRSVSRGLARIDAPTGSFVAYATAPGDVAVDGDGLNSPFSLALANLLPTPDKPIEQMFKEVRIEVLKATDGRQTPWDSSSLVDDFYFKAAAAVTAPEPVELSLWQSVSNSGDTGRLALFLQVYPNSQFAPQARSLLAEAMAADPDITKQSGGPALDPAPKPDAGPGAPPLSETASGGQEASEHEMIALAQTSRAVSDYQNYLTAYPDGVFADLARAEIESIAGNRQDVAATPMATLQPSEPPALEGPLLFDQRLGEGSQTTVGRSLRQLAQGSAEYSPVDGLDEAYWRGQKCTNCHNWTRETLCRQGTFYTSSETPLVERIAHPYGGPFKIALLQWATTGCQ